VVAAVLSVGWFGAPVVAAPKVAVETVYYDVRGGDAQALLAYMLRHGPGGPTGRALGTTSAVLSHDSDFSGEARCRLQNYRVDLDLVVRLPRLANGQQLSGSLSRQWTSFAEHVRVHENTHVTIYKRCAGRIEQRVRALDRSMSCQALQSRMRRIFDEENDRCDGEHRTFDAREETRILRLPLIVRASQPAQSAPASQSRQLQQAASAPGEQLQALSAQELK
jgi:predicted secreted Zn-dependent protease